MTRPVRAHNRADATAAPLARLGTMDADATLEEQAARLSAFRAYVRFESRDPEANRDRYYDVLWQPTLFGEGALVRTWGRQGQPGTTRATFYPDRDGAVAEIRQVVRRRLAHGYRVIAWQ